jgi:hypothetical protein
MMGQKVIRGEVWEIISGYRLAYSEDPFSN